MTKHKKRILKEIKEVIESSFPDSQLYSQEELTQAFAEKIIELKEELARAREDRDYYQNQSEIWSPS
jgi:hypothetical protein